MKLKTKPSLITTTEKDYPKFFSSKDKIKIILQTLSLKEQMELADAQEKGNDLDLIVGTAKKIIYDWSGLKDEDGQEIPFNEEALTNLIEYTPEFIMAIVEVYTDKTSEVKEKAKK